MCPACVASAATIALSATSTGGILALLVHRFRRWKEFLRRAAVQKGKEN